MKILLVDIKYDYGISARGMNTIGELGFKKSFLSLGHEVVSFYYDDYLKSNLGGLQVDLLAFVDKQEPAPDLIFFILYTDQFTTKTLDTLKEKYVTINWFGDDSWRFNSFTKIYAPHFTHCITTDKFSLPKYQTLSIKPIVSQWAAIDMRIEHFTGNENKSDNEKSDSSDPKHPSYKYDVTFIGHINPFRKWFVSRVKKMGFKVEAFGHGWSNGPVSMDDMFDIFRTSKINLNLSNSKSYDYRYLFSGPKNFIHTFYTPKVASQIKARNFEIPFYGGFQLGDFAPGIGDFLEIDREIVCYRDLDEACFLIDYYLKNDQQREIIKQRGHLRALKEHSYKNRFESIVKEIG